MTEVRYGFDGGANGQAVTAASTGLAQINASGTAGSTMVYQNSGSADGVGHLLHTPVSGGVLQGVANLNDIRLAMIKVKQDALPVNSANFAQLFGPSSSVITFSILSTGQIKIGTWVSAGKLAEMPGWMRLVVWRAPDGSNYKVGIFQGESSTPYEPIYNAGAAIGAGVAINSFRFGRPSQSVETMPLRFDSVLLNDTATDISTAPFTPVAPPTINGSVDTTSAWLDLRSSTPSNLTWTPPAGVTTILPGLYRVARSDQDQALTFTARDTSGLQSSKTFTIPRLGAQAEILVSDGTNFLGATAASPGSIFPS